MKKVLVIDNFDSFTYNIVQYLKELGVEVEVFQNNEISINDISAKNVVHIILAPGAGNPDNAGICLDLLKHFYNQRKILGICLGHQCIAQFFGAKIIKDKKPMHGKISEVIHYTSEIFQHIPQNFNVTRYHSLIVDKKSVPSDLKIIAETLDGIIMGIQHKNFPIYGVQYHPESILTEFGHELLENFMYRI